MGVIRTGCGGCLLVVGVLVLVGVVLAGAAWIGTREVDVASEELAPELPVAPSEVPVSSSGAVDPELAGPVLGRGGADPVGIVHLDLRHGEIVVRPAPPGERLRVEATFDRETHELSERLVTDDGGRWRYEVRFAARGGGWLTALRQLFSGVSPRVEVLLPPDIPIELELEVAQGGGTLELGGLSLRAAGIEATQGGFELFFSEPNREAMESLRIRTSMGGFTATRLGNASPARVEIETSMGGAEVDLRGRWRQDAEVELRTEMGGASVRLPREVNLRGVPGHEREGLDAPTVHLRVHAQWGEVELVER